MDVRSRRVSSSHAWREGDKEIRDFLEWGGGTLGGDHQAGCCGCGGHGFDTHSCFSLDFPEACLGAAVDLGSGF